MGSVLGCLEETVELRKRLLELEKKLEQQVALHKIDAKKEKLVAANIIQAQTKSEARLVANKTEQHKIFELAAKLSSDVIWDWDLVTNDVFIGEGFKELFGTTIFDFYQSQRMEHARYLLYEKGLSVTDVSMLLGYSSISHFSTAFKKHTGLKPCELLLH